MNVGERLKKLRKKLNISQQELSNRLGLNRATYARYETNDNQADYDTLQKLADFFGESVDYLLGRTDETNQNKKESADSDNLENEIDRLINDPETGIFFKGYLDAPEEKKKQMRDFMRFLLQEEKGRKPGDKQGE